ncbi:DUF5110 domain-containing protein, partial [Streptomyces sp. SID8455]|nr:DUF5110 domain-containing protein [Streptomyces sp. SID8455]
LPYQYSYAHEATKTGVGMVRPLVLEYPDDPEASTEAAKYEFLSGEHFLVAPVYQDTTERRDIYLPKGTWIDYWSGRTYEGPTTIDSYSAPLDTLPLFVKAGAAVPMWPGIRSYRDRTPSSPLAWDIYPQGNTSFTLYEDDGVTRQHRDGKYATQRADVRAPVRGAGDVKVTINESRGSFTGKQSERPYEFTVHTGSEPGSVRLDRTLPRLTSEAAYKAAQQGWWYDRDDRGGVVHVKTAPLRTDRKFTVKLSGTSAVGGKKASAAAVLSAPAGQEAGAGTPGQVQVDITAGSADLTDASVTLQVPAGWKSTPAKVPGRIPAGATRRVAVEVTPAKHAEVRETRLTALARYRAAGDARTTEQRLALSVLPPP